MQWTGKDSGYLIIFQSGRQSFSLLFTGFTQRRVAIAALNAFDFVPLGFTMPDQDYLDQSRCPFIWIEVLTEYGEWIAGAW